MKIASFFLLNNLIFSIFHCCSDISLQDKIVIYDNEKQQIGWVSSNCNRLPKSWAIPCYSIHLMYRQSGVSHLHFSFFLFSFFPFFLLFINRVDRDYNEDFWQPYAADFSVLEENYPATAQNIIRLLHERNFNV